MNQEKMNGSASAVSESEKATASLISSASAEKLIELSICVGTACWVMGGADLMDIESYLPQKVLNRVKMTGSPCMERCRGAGWTNPPYVSVNGTVIGGITPQVLREYLENYPGDEDAEEVQM